LWYRHHSEGRYRLAGGLRPFQGLVLWYRHYSEGRYRLAGGLRPFRAMLCSPEGAIYTNVGYSPSGKNMKTFQGLVLWYRHYSEGRYRLAGGLRPFQGLVLWYRHHSEGRYRLAGGLRPFRAMLCSPEGAIYTNDGYSPSDKNKNAITSPEGAQ